MGQKAITIYTPAGESGHISADDDAFIYRLLFGGASGILGGLVCSKISNNTVRLSGGGAMNRGHILRIPDGETLDLSVDSGLAGYNRCDSVVIEFIKGGGGTADICRLRVVTGTAVTGTPQPPTLVRSDLLNQGDVNQAELFRLTLSGTTLSSVTKKAALLTTAGGVGIQISTGTEAPSGGSDGDIYLRIM